MSLPKVATPTSQIPAPLDLSRGKRLVVDVDRMDRSLRSRSSLLRTLYETCEVFEELLGDARCALFLHRPERRELELVAGPSLGDRLISKLHTLPVRTTSTSCGVAISEGRTVAIDDTEESSAWRMYLQLARETQIRSSCSVPLPLANDGTNPTGYAGTIAFYFKTPQRFPLELIARLEALAEIAANIFNGTQMLQQFYKDSHLDPLTRLPGRKALLDHLKELLSASDPDVTAESRTRFALALIDVRQTQEINATLGFQMGDQALQLVGKRLQGLAGPDEKAFRMAGDVFAMTLQNIPSSKGMSSYAERLAKAINQPHDIANQQLHVTCNVGISVYPWDGEDRETLLRNSETALSHTKAEGRSNFETYQPSMSRDRPTVDLWFQRTKLGAELRDVLARRELALHYQLKYRADRRTVGGAEALIRWHHPTLGLLTPGRFIDLAEQTGLVLNMDRWILREACLQSRRWQDAGITNVPISVNISPGQFSSHTLVDYLCETLAETGVEPQAIELEITERTAMQDGAKALKRLRQLRELGVGLSIDDFGTGYSSLSYLSQFPIHTLKIDRAFVKDIGTGSAQDFSSQTIVRAIISMAKALSLEIVAEGVETSAQVDFMIKHQCDLIQGYFFHKPATAQETLQTLFDEARPACL